MHDSEKTPAMLQKELAALRRRLAELESDRSRATTGSDSPDNRARELVETMTPVHDLALHLSPSGIIRYCLSRHKTVFGYRAANLAGRHLREIVPQSSYGPFNKGFEAVFEGMSIGELEHGVVTAKGATARVRSSLLPIRHDGQVEAAVCLMTDCTATRRRERRQRANERFLRDILETSSNITIVATDLEQNILYWNPGAERVLGYTAEEMVGKEKIARLYDRRYTDTIARIAEARHRILEERRGTTFDAVEIRKDGRPLWVKLTLTPRFDEQGNVIGVLGIGQDITEHKSAETRLNQSLRDLRRAMNATIHAIALTVEKRDPYTAGHQHRVADLGRSIATEMKLSGDQIDCIRMGGIIHDLGKVFVPAEILNRPGSLSATEMAIIKSHSESGYEIVRYIDFPWNVSEVILDHHERLDGSGYPAGKTGPQIGTAAKIVAVADVVESMSSHRPYRPALGLSRALQEIERHKGTKYDPSVVDCCLSLFREKGYTLKDLEPWRCRQAD
jgi:PAS domain S-box-containing protein/putative nucleotidyltransferase with HDIG domain